MATLQTRLAKVHAKDGKSARFPRKPCCMLKMAKVHAFQEKLAFGRFWLLAIFLESRKAIKEEETFFESVSESEI